MSLSAQSTASSRAKEQEFYPRTGNIGNTKGGDWDCTLDSFVQRKPAKVLRAVALRERGRGGKGCPSHSSLHHAHGKRKRK
jgi:hypothetical protein